MEFCPECKFLLYYVDSEENELYTKCKNCGYNNKSEKIIISTNIYKKAILKNVKSKKNYIHDNAYAHTIHYRCPNKKCETYKKPELKDAVFFNDSDSLQLIYICTVCKTEWK